jgi:hypothetical protein
VKPTADIRNRCDSIALAAPTSQAFPKTVSRCQATTRADLVRPCAGRCRSSFRTISQRYFASEAPKLFAHEAVLFFIMMTTAALPLLNASIAILALIRI